MKAFERKNERMKCDEAVKYSVPLFLLFVQNICNNRDLKRFCHSLTFTRS